jgi:hypothetical protein
LRALWTGIARRTGGPARSFAGDEQEQRRGQQAGTAIVQRAGLRWGNFLSGLSGRACR